MYDSPGSLQDACVDFICENIEAICELQTNLDDKTNKLTFKDNDIYFHTEISEQLLTTLCEKGKLTDTTLTLFDANITRLKYVRIPNATNVTTKGLRVLRSHKILYIEATGLKVTVNNLIGCLGEWTLQHLRSLSVANSTFLDASKYCVVVALSKLRNLQVLNVSNTEFNKHGLEIVAEDLPLLENLDISCTRVTDISPLRKCKDRLKYFSMYSLKHANSENVIPVILELHQLRHLDISDDQEVHPFDMFEPTKHKIGNLLSSRENMMPYLSSLDISGNDDINIDELKLFLKHHTCMKFLGLVQTEVCYEDIFTDENHPAYNPDLVVTGSATEAQIVEALRRYTSRPLYVQKSLYFLFRLTQNYSEPRVDIIKLLKPGMQLHPNEFAIQMAATACLYNLSKGEIGQHIHPSILKDVVHYTLDAMENFPNHQQLQKNTLLTLCSDRILQDVSFDKHRCARLVMDSLCMFDDPSMNRMSVAICSILAAKISTVETSMLGSVPRYMQKLLSIVRRKMEAHAVDITMKFTLSALWNLTDESPSTCAVFLEEGGMALFLQVLQKFPEESAVETKILGLVNNIAEVTYLRQALMVEEFIHVLRKLLHSAHIDVSYFAAGIIAHLASDGLAVWTVTSVTRMELLKELGEVVLGWKTPEGEMVAYRSFHPFFPLLACYEAFEVQLWAVWAIQHVCTKNSKRYCPMLVDEGGDRILHSLLGNTVVNANVSGICSSVLEVLNTEGYSRR